MYGLRASVEDKLHRLPATYFQEQSRGDVLSRATNDIDNIAQALNQVLTQLIMSVLMLCGCPGHDALDLAAAGAASPWSPCRCPRWSPCWWRAGPRHSLPGNGPRPAS